MLVSDKREPESRQKAMLVDQDEGDGPSTRRAVSHGFSQRETSLAINP